MSLVDLLRRDAEPLARLFDSATAQRTVLAGGETLYRAGEPADRLYLLRAGRLGAFREHDGGGPRQFLGVIRPGEPVGEMSLIAGTPHSSAVVALRDSEVVSVDARTFLRAVRRDGRLVTELARLALTRIRGPEATGSAALTQPSVFGLVAAQPEVSAVSLAGRLRVRLEAQGLACAVLGAEAAGRPLGWYGEVEGQHDVVLYAADLADAAWAETAGRQVDRLYLVGRGAAPPPPASVKAGRGSPLRAQQLVELILTRPAGAAPAHSQGWQDATGASRLLQVEDGSDADLDRLGRVLTGRAVALVLSGGGARAYAHLGAVRALREAGTPLDLLAGVSMGGIVAAGVALGWSDAELDRRIRAAFVGSNPLGDAALPLLSLSRGERVRRRLAEHFGEVDIADLPLPFLCLSSNLTTGQVHLHRSGPVREALRASISLPGVLPPVVAEGQVLVDGAVLRNFPADLVRAQHAGPLIGVDVSRSHALMPEDVVRPGLWSWLASGGWRKGPPMVSVLMRAATVSSGGDKEAARQACHLVISPRLEGVDLRNWRDYDRVVEAGYQATKAALAKLDAPVAELRRRSARATPQ